MGLDDPTTYFYQFISIESDSNDTKIIQYFIMHGLRLCIKFNSFLAHTFYAWSFSNNIAVSIDIKKNKYFLYLNIYTSVFSRGTGNLNKHITQQLDSSI